jgi:hypothetical protein
MFIVYFGIKKYPILVFPFHSNRTYDLLMRVAMFDEPLIKVD